MPLTRLINYTADIRKIASYFQMFISEDMTSPKKESYSNIHSTVEEWRDKII